MSIDVDAFVAPKGLDCPDIDACNARDNGRSCDLCDSESALKFLRAKGVRYAFDKAAARALELHDGLAKKDASEEAAGKSGEGSKGGPAHRPESDSSGAGEVRSRPSRAQRMIERGESLALGKRAKSGLAKSASACD